MTVRRIINNLRTLRFRPNRQALIDDGLFTWRRVYYRGVWTPWMRCEPHLDPEAVARIKAVGGA